MWSAAIRTGGLGDQRGRFSRSPHRRLYRVVPENDPLRSPDPLDIDTEFGGAWGQSPFGPVATRYRHPIFARLNFAKRSLGAYLTYRQGAWGGSPGGGLSLSSEGFQGVLRGPDVPRVGRRGSTCRVGGCPGSPSCTDCRTHRAILERHRLSARPTVPGCRDTWAKHRSPTNEKSSPSGLPYRTSC